MFFTLTGTSMTSSTISARDVPGFNKTTVVAAVIKLSDGGPVFFLQRRVGLDGEIFMMTKFRSMVVQDEKDEKKGWTTKNDPRVTPIGKFIRKTSIDELPQLTTKTFTLNPPYYCI